MSDSPQPGREPDQDQDQDQAPARRRGRPPKNALAEGPGARERILVAARGVFAERGYDKTSVRAIAQLAGVDASLVHHYYGTKDEVFAAAIELSFEPTEGLTELVGERPEQLGERLARVFLGVWENPTTRAPLLAIVRSALTHEAAAKVLREYVLHRLLQRIATELDVPHPRFRAELAASHMVGIALLRYVVKVEPMASADPEQIIAAVAPTLQRYLTDPDPTGPQAATAGAPAAPDPAPTPPPGR